MIRNWLPALLAGIILSILAVYPQWNLQKIRGEEFEGAFASCDLDEMAYAAYLQALIDGRPRRNDPYTGRDHSPDDPQPESLFSIQFAGAYLAAVPARVIGINVPTLMPLISVFSAFFTALALYWMVFSVTRDELLSFTATLAIMVCGALVSGIGAVNALLENGAAYPFFPYMRRHIPSLAFPFLFAFFACLWNGLRTERKRPRIIYSILSALCFAVLVFSYFYVWTTAAAVLGALALFVLIFRSEAWKRDLLFLVQTGILCVLPLIPYAILLAGRNQMMDKAQLLVLTRQPDLWRTIEIVGYVVLAVLAVAVWQRWTVRAERAPYFIAAFAAAPFLVLNQQVLTARSLQPFHYEFYATNYVVLLGLVLLLAVLWQRFLRGPVSVVLLVMISLAAVLWGHYEARETTVFWDDANIARDEAMPVNRRLRQLAAADIDAAREQTTLNLDALQADSQNTVAPQPVLWARHQHTFAGIRSWDENKLRYYELLYFSDLDADWLRSSLTGCRDIEACMALFGWDRFNATLSANARPLTQPEIDEEVENFRRFSEEFDQEDARRLHLSYLIVRNESADRLVNVDRWYDRGVGEQHGRFTIYPLAAK